MRVPLWVSVFLASGVLLHQASRCGSPSLHSRAVECAARPEPPPPLAESRGVSEPAASLPAAIPAARVEEAAIAPALFGPDLTTDTADSCTPK